MWFYSLSEGTSGESPAVPKKLGTMKFTYLGIQINSSVKNFGTFLIAVIIDRLTLYNVPEGNINFHRLLDTIVHNVKKFQSNCTKNFKIFKI